MPQIIQRSFTSGEISKSLQSRADIIKYSTGLNLCENFIVKAQGGVYNRPGFRFVGELDDSLKVGRLIPFSFNTTQTYALVFENLKMRVIRDARYMLVGGAGSAIFEMTTPYTTSQLSRLSYTQDADVMTISHPSHDPMNINRLADNNWTITTVSYAANLSAPVFSGSTVKVISGATKTNPAKLTVTGHGFTTGNTIDVDAIVGMVQLNGRSFRISVIDSNTVSLDGEDATSHSAYISGGTATRNNAAVTVGSGFGSFNKNYIYVVTTVDTDGIESVASASTALLSNSLSTTGGIRLSWNAVVGAEYYRVYKDPSDNTGLFGWIGDSKNNSFDDYNIAPIVSDAPPEDRQPFTGVDNKPAVVEYYDQRQVFANTNNKPQVVYTTQVGDFNSLRSSNPARDDDAITFTINAKQVNEIRHIISLDKLLLLTSGGEWKVNEGQDDVLTPSTAGIKIQSYNGASWVKPVIVNSTVIYVQEKKSRIRDLNVNDFGDKYISLDLSIMSEHLFEKNEIVEMAYADEPYGIVWCVRDDGVLLGLTYLKEQKVWGWHQHTTQGEFESVITISEDNRDAVYVIVKRYINGLLVRYVERLEKREDDLAEDSFYVDSGITFTTDPTTIINGLDHLESQDVAVLADGNVIENMTVVSGSITLPSAARKIHVGLSYTPAIELLDVDVASTVDTLKTESVSVSKVFIEVENSRGGFVGPRKDDTGGGEVITFTEIKPRFQSDEYDSIKLKTYKQEVSIDPQWSKGGGVRIEQRAPLPLAILSVTPRVDIGGS